MKRYKAYLSPIIFEAKDMDDAEEKVVIAMSNGVIECSEIKEIEESDTAQEKIK